MEDMVEWLLNVLFFHVFGPYTVYLLAFGAFYVLARPPYIQNLSIALLALQHVEERLALVDGFAGSALEGLGGDWDRLHLVAVVARYQPSSEERYMVGRLLFLAGGSFLSLEMSLKVIPFMVIIFGLKGLLTLHRYWGTAVHCRVIF